MGMPLSATTEVPILEQPTVTASGELGTLHSEMAEKNKVGRKLAAAREARGFSYEDVLAGTKIKIGNLIAIEAGERAMLPAIPYTAGFIKAYAQFLGLDPEEYSCAWRAEVGAVAPPPTVSVEAAAPAASMKAPAGSERMIAYFGAGATLLCILWIGATALSSKREPNAPNANVESTERQPAPIASTVVFAEASDSAIAVPATKPADAKTEQLKSVSAAPATTIESARVETVEAAGIETGAGAASALEETEPQIASAPEAREAAPAPSPPTAGPEGIAPPDAERRSSPFADVPAAATQAAPPKVVNARMTRSAAPSYPERCGKKAAATESVDVVFDITAEGRPMGARVVGSTNDCFNAAAVESASRMRFAPRTIDGEASVETAKEATVQFVR